MDAEATPIAKEGLESVCFATELLE